MMSKNDDLLFVTDTEKDTQVIVGEDYKSMRFEGVVICHRTFSTGITYSNIFADYVDETTYNCWRILPYKINDVYVNCGNIPAKAEFYNNGDRIGNMFVEGNEIHFVSDYDFCSLNDISLVRRVPHIYVAANPYPIFIGAGWKWKWFKIWRSGTLVADYKPRQIGGRVVFYDKVSNTFII